VRMHCPHISSAGPIMAMQSCFTTKRGRRCVAIYPRSVIIEILQSNSPSMLNLIFSLIIKLFKFLILEFLSIINDHREDEWL